MRAPTIAVDFGTTRTKVAFFDEKEQQPRLIELGRANLQVIPSVFYVPRDVQAPRLVGDDAQEMVDEDPEGIVENLKKEIHRSAKLRFGRNRPSVDRVELAGELFAYLRRRCREEVFYSEVNSCVLTLPVVFEEQKRECIRRAAELGGFRADRIQVIEEPVAAARAWLWQWEGRIAESVIVCDVGGGTTDFALLRYRDGDFEPVPELAKGGLPQGGNDLDEGILEEALARQERTPLWSELRMAFLNKGRQLKERLVRDVRQLFSLRLPGGEIVVPREVVETQTRQFVERVVEEFRRFLTRCGSVADLSGTPVLLVGGASRILGLKEAMEAASPAKVYQWNKSDYAVALGAAVMPRPRKPVVAVEGLNGGGGSGPTAPPASPGPVAVFNDPGTYLVQAVRQANVGANVALPAGEYRISQPLIIERPLKIAGLGWERTKILWEGEGPAIICRGECDLTLRDVTVERVGRQAGQLLDAFGGRVKIEDSRICGARGASGVRLRGGVRAEIRRCQIDGNSEHGIVLGDSAQALLEENTCEKNSKSGIAYAGASGGTARKNLCRENGVAGIGIVEQASPQIEENTCENNKEMGIGYLGSSRGTARKNICRENGVAGIGIGEQAAPQLEENSCEKNRETGIRYRGSSGGLARKNICRENGVAGIWIVEQAAPQLEENSCENNKGMGIGYLGSSRGTARKNTCRENAEVGIRAVEQAAPQLEENVCEKNKEAGIQYQGSSRGLARKNICRENGVAGIGIVEQAAPQLEENTCEKNIKCGIRYSGTSGGTARKNICRENGEVGIWIVERAAPQLEENSCEKNRETGIRYRGSSGGLARKNICRENGLAGIGIGEQAAPQLEENSCENNKGMGILYLGSSRGTARKNICRENGGAGIVIIEQAAPQLEENSCENNQNSGILYWDSSRGTARGNVCSSNHVHGIAVYSTGGITLHGNRCRGNKHSGIYLNGSSAHATVLRENVCTKNSYGVQIGANAWRRNAAGEKLLKSGQTGGECESSNDCRQNSSSDWSWNSWFD